MSLNHEIRLGLHDTFLKRFAQMPKDIQSKTHKFIKLYRADPTSSGINYEAISDFSDKQLKSCRIGLDYRLIIRKPEVGNLYLIIWIDHHDEAYQWAKHKVFHLNEHNQAFEMFDEKVFSDLSESHQKQTPKTKLFDAYTSQQLEALGLSKKFVKLAKLIDTLETLASFQEILPQRAFCYLSMLSDGHTSYAEVLKLSQSENELQLSSPQEVKNDQDPLAGLEAVATSAVNQEQIFVLTDDQDIDWILNKPLDRWRVFLHSSQRKIVENPVKGTVRVLGGAGTGKTVVAMHRIKWLIENVLSEDERIQFMTHTTTLTRDLSTQLDLLLSKEQKKQVAVVNFDAWLKMYFKKYNQADICYWNGKGHDKLQTSWEKAFKNAPEGFNTHFLRMEWEQIILGQGITDLSTYLYASRTGRSIPLKKSQRKEIWPFFKSYITHLSQGNVIEPEMAMWTLVSIGLKSELECKFRSIVIDEAQDFSTAAFRLLRVLMPRQDNDLFIVGDGNQKIYSRPISLKQSGIYIQGANRAYRLRLNYRTTEEIHNAAMSVIKGQGILDLDEESDTLSDYQSLLHGESPKLYVSANPQDRQTELLKWISVLPSDRLNELCIVARNKHTIETYKQLLSDHEYEIYHLDQTNSADSDKPGIRLANSHRIKGLEFSFIALVDQDSKFKGFGSNTGDSAYEKQKVKEERSLCYVAISRARERLFVSQIE